MCLNADRRDPEEKERLNIQVREETPSAPLKYPCCEKTRWNAVQEPGQSQSGTAVSSPTEEMAREKRST